MLVLVLLIAESFASLVAFPTTFCGVFLLVVIFIAVLVIVNVILVSLHQVLVLDVAQRLHKFLLSIQLALDGHLVLRTFPVDGLHVLASRAFVGQLRCRRDAPVAKDAISVVRVVREGLALKHLVAQTRTFPHFMVRSGVVLDGFALVGDWELQLLVVWPRVQCSKQCRCLKLIEVQHTLQRMPTHQETKGGGVVREGPGEMCQVVEAPLQRRASLQGERTGQREGSTWARDCAA